MRITDPISKFLAIPGFSVVNVERMGQSEIWIELDSLSSRHRCPLCRGPGTRYDCVYRRIQDLPFGPTLVFLLVPVTRILCARCGVHQVRLSWTAPGARRTRRLDHMIYLMTEETTVSYAAALNSLSWDTVHRIEVRFARERLRGRFRGPYRKIGIDEVSYGKRHRYLTIVTDLERRRVIWIGKNRREETLEKFVRWLGPMRSKVKFVVLDMHQPYINIIRRRMPRATIVFDRFHLMKLLTGAVDEVRRRVQSALPPADRKILKNKRYVLLANRDDLSPAKEIALRELLEVNWELSTTYLLKEDFRALFDTHHLEVAERRFRAWAKRVRESKVPELKAFAKTLRRHWKGVMAYFRSGRLSNGLAESFNNVIATIRKKGYGYRNLDNLFMKIHREVGEIGSELQRVLQKRIAL